MMKYVNNTLLATLISSVNEYSNIARGIGNIDFEQVMNGVHLDHRWTPLSADGQKVFPKIIDYLKPGCGYGGSCFPKDVMALSALANDKLMPSRIIDAVIDVNDNQPNVMVEILKTKVGVISNKRVLVLGLAFKPETDDVRESVSLKLLKLLNDEVFSLSAHDPVAIDNTRQQLGSSVKIEYVQDWRAAISNNDIIIFATNWSIYKSILESKDMLVGKCVFDTRSLFDANAFPGATYLSIN
jgi:UDPglucose 6-dehydrogenase